MKAKSLNNKYLVALQKDYKENVVLPLVVTGLPVTCFGSQHEQLQRALKRNFRTN